MDTSTWHAASVAGLLQHTWSRLRTRCSRRLPSGTSASRFDTVAARVHEAVNDEVYAVIL